MRSNRDQEPNTTEHRIRILVRVALGWALILFLQLVHLQVISHADYERQAQKQQEKELEIQAPRGAILDRNGQPLAMSLPVDSVCVNPQRVPDLGVAAEVFAHELELDPNTLLGRLKIAQDAGKGFLWIKRKVSPSEAGRLRSYGFDWIEFRQESRRFYPNGQLAAHVVGSVDHDEKGNVGVEAGLNDDLEGHAGVMRQATDVRQNVYESEIFTEPQPGKSVTLTVDSRIQYVAERALAAAVESNSCKTGSLVVMAPASGEILALANYPTFDPNQPLKPEESLADRNNLAVSVPFEPGSVFKVITVSAALETTSLRPETVVSCGNGTLRLAGRIIHDHDSYSALSVADVLAKSSNIGAINIGLRVGQERLLEYVLRFGFGRETGLPLPAESSGVVRPLTQWQASSIGSVAMGHEVSTTTVQLARACSVIANGGMLVSPRVVKSRQRTGQAPEAENAAAAPKRVLQPETVMTMRTMMEGVVLRGTGKKARLDRYTTAGKTGSAQIFDAKTHQYSHRYNASFMGFAPVNNPAIVVVVTLNGASQYGGAVAAPVFHDVAAAALRILDVPNDLPDGLTVDDKGDAGMDDSTVAELGTIDDPAHASATPAAPTTTAALGPMQGPALPPQPPNAVITGPRVPDFRGMTVRGVLEESTRTRVQVETVGSGVARWQSPAAGAILPPGERVRVQFAR